MQQNPAYYYPKEEEYSIFYTKCTFPRWIKWINKMSVINDRFEPVFNNDKTKSQPNISYIYDPFGYISYNNKTGNIVLRTLQSYKLQKEEVNDVPHEFALLKSISENDVIWTFYSKSKGIDQ